MPTGESMTWRDEIEPATVRIRDGEKSDLLVIMNPKVVTNQWERKELQFPVAGIMVEGCWRPCDKTWKVTAKALMSSLKAIPYDIARIHVECYGSKKDVIYVISGEDGIITHRDLYATQTHIPCTSPA